MEDLQIWQKAIELSKLVYQETKHFPEDERFGLVSQMRRCSISVASNIAEGRGRETMNNKKEFLPFLRIAKGSLYELKTQAILADEFDYLCNQDLLEKIEELSRMLSSFIKSLAELPISLTASLCLTPAHHD